MKGNLVKLNVRGLLGSTSMVAIFVVIGVFVAAMGGLIAGGLAFEGLSQQQRGDTGLMNEYVGLTVYIIAAVVAGVGFSTIYSSPLIREKSNGTIETLLATPISPARLVTAKAIAITLLAVPVGLVCGGVVGAVLWGRYSLGAAVAPAPFILVTVLFVTPLIYFTLALIVYAIGVAARTADGVVIVSIFITGFSAVMLNMALRDVTPPESLSFLLLNLAWALVFGVIAAVALPRISREKAIA